MGPDDGGEPIAIEVSDTQAHLRVDPALLAARARRALEAEGIDRAAISVALVDDATIHELNRRHLGHDEPTDVISFVLSEPDDPALAGELVISAEMAVRTAREVGVDPTEELVLYLVHGLLHLCGQDDRTAAETAAMRRREAEVLAVLGVANTFPHVGPAGPEDAGRESQR